MILKCPSCEAKYEIADGALTAAGRNVRCAACGHYWFQKPDGIEEFSVLEKENSIKIIKESPALKENRKIGFGAEKNKKAKAPHQEMRARAHNKIKISQMAGIAAGWFSATCILLSLIFVVVQNRVLIAKKWPKSASLFAALGTPVNLYGLEIKNVSLSMGQDAHGPRMIIKASVVNISNNAKTVPYLRVTLFDGNKSVLSWLVDPKVTFLEKGAKVDIEGIKRSPPNGNYRAQISFSEMPKDISVQNVAENHSQSENDLLLKSSSNELEGSHEDPQNHAAEAPPNAHAQDQHTSPTSHEAPKDLHTTAVGR